MRLQLVQMRGRRDPVRPCLRGELVRLIEGIRSSVQGSARAVVAATPRAVGEFPQFVHSAGLSVPHNRSPPNGQLATAAAAQLSFGAD